MQVSRLELPLPRGLGEVNSGALPSLLMANLDSIPSFGWVFFLLCVAIREQGSGIRDQNVNHPLSPVFCLLNSDSCPLLRFGD
jgi:hypothetical protein